MSLWHIHLVSLLTMSLAVADDSPLLSRLMEGLGSVANAPAHEVQVLYVQIEKTPDGLKFTEHGWHLDAERYFYPASTVKLPVALFALDKLANLSVPGLNRETAMSMPSNEDGPSSVAEDVRQIFLVSDNTAFNRLFTFVSEEAIWLRLHGLRLSNTHIANRLGLYNGPFIGPIRFLDESGEVLHSERSILTAGVSRSRGKRIHKGIGYLNSGGVLVNEPMNFSFKNAFPLSEQHLFLREVFFPREGGLKLTPADSAFVKTTMGQFPRECLATADDSIRNKPDTYVKNFLGWADAPIRDSLRCYNKSGQAYGYMVDNAYIVDRDHDVAFFLAAVIHVNANQIYNDNVYEYETIGEPFMKALGKAVYDYERSLKSRKSP